MFELDTIAAPATPLSPAGIGIIRISGPEAVINTDKIFCGKVTLAEAKTHTIHYGKIMDGDEIIDEVLVSVMRGPHSYTGEDVTEINFEPWHMRYVGIPTATYIMENGLCLEEFTQQLQAAIDDYIARGGDPAKVEPFIQKPTEE